MEKSLDPENIASGVEVHRYKLNAPIGEQELSKLEAHYNIELPGDYRFFLVNIENGGAGPGYGLYSLQGALTGNDCTYHRYPSSAVGKEIAGEFVRPDEDADDEYLENSGALILCQNGCANDDFLILNGRERSFVWRYIEWLGHHIPLLKQMPTSPQFYKLKGSDRLKAKDNWLHVLFSARAHEKMTFYDWYLDWLNQPPEIVKKPAGNQ